MTGTAMTTNYPDCLCTVGRRVAAALLLTLVGGCAGLLPKAPAPPAFYALEGLPVLPAPARPKPAATAPTLLVDPPRAAGGYDSKRIIYLRKPLQLEYYAHSEWIDTPARLLAPMLVTAASRTGALGAVTLSPGSAASDLRLSTDLLRLQHDFSSSPSQVHFTLRASLVDSKTRRVLAERQFEHSVAAGSEDAYGGVVAANRAVQAVLNELTEFVAEAAGRWPVPASAGQADGRPAR